MASSIGTSHIAAAQPCQDTDFHVEATGPDGERTMVLAVSDGAGTAALAEVGAALVCDTFGDDHACILLAAVVGEREAVFLQIGDGAIVLSAGGGWMHVFWPQHGEFANTTNVITSAHRLEALEFETLGEPVEELALFTDGLENLVLQKAAKAVHAPFFESMFPAVRRSTASGVAAELSRSLGCYLSSAPVNDRTDDDKTLVLASRRQA